jgi:flagellar hook-associated protein 1 FlgK
MTDLALSIAASGLDAQQTVMDTISQNLANASTPGYVSEGAVLTTDPSSTANGVGDGVRVATIAQTPDQLARTADQQAKGTLASSTALQQVLTEVQDAFPEPNSGQGISNQLASFWSSWDAITQDPSSPAPYTQVVDEAQGLATSLQQASQTITQAAGDAQSQLSSLVSTDNGLLQQVAALNQQINGATQSGGSASSLIDQQNQLVDQLASDLGATAITQPDGTVTLSVGGTTLVNGATATTLAVRSTPPATPGGAPTFSVVDTANGLALPVSGSSGTAGTAGTTATSTSGLSGTAGGLLTALNTYLPSYQSQLDQVASSLATGVNGMLAAGYTTAGTAGSPLFVTSDGSATFTAANLAVSSTVAANPSATLAVSSSATASPNNGANAQTIAETGSATTYPPNAQYTAFIQNLGAQVQAVGTQVTADTSVATSAKETLSEVAGVNQNQQMIALLDAQHAYEASAQVVSTVNTAIQALLQAV